MSGGRAVVRSGGLLRAVRRLCAIEIGIERQSRRHRAGFARQARPNRTAPAASSEPVRGFRAARACRPLTRGRRRGRR
ncbi:hypothetical protein WI23_17925 [Burkholderia oklahomensis C6786]|nr:hypothetical protein WI23_17925 [Burkholderia oklahomensis C6786]KUY61728.1 hypothetical protein WI23_11180 [Burkholderia oklahomensis C6786]